jgi:hypothetical protein
VEASAKALTAQAHSLAVTYRNFHRAALLPAAPVAAQLLLPVLLLALLALLLLLLLPLLLLLLLLAG